MIGGGYRETAIVDSAYAPRERRMRPAFGISVAARNLRCRENSSTDSTNVARRVSIRHLHLLWSEGLMKRTATIGASVLSEPKSVVGSASRGAPHYAPMNLPRPVAEPPS
jgi:hypothetical protein